MSKLIDITGKVISGEWGDEDEEGKGIPVLRTTNFTNEGVINYSNVVTRIIQKRNITDKFLCKGDIIIEKSGGSDTQPVGRVVYFDGEEDTYLFNNFTGLLRVADHSICFPRYLFYVLFYNYSIGGTIPFQNKTTGLHNLKTDDYIRSFEITMPPLENQRKIAATLDKVTHLIDLCKQQLETLDLLVKSRFIELFRNYDLSAQCSNWQRIDEIGVVIGGATPKTNIADYWNGEYLWITPAELSDDTGYIFDSVRKITKLGIESCSLQEIPKGTVILTSRAPIGKLAIAGSKMYCNQGFKNIICREKIIPRYLYNLLLYNVNYLNSLGRGATFKEISKKIVESILIPVPSLALQEQFAAFVETTDKSKLAVQKQLETLETLKKSLMQEYFG